MKELKEPGLSKALGFKTNGLWCGIKKKNPDLALIYSIVPARAAGVFTSNKVKAAPVHIDQKNLKNNLAQAIIINSGNANCCTGKRGFEDARKTAVSLARCLQLKESDVLVASTGVIGKFLPVEKILNAIPELVSGLDFNKDHLAMKAIMTTDKFAKESAVEILINKKKVTIAAMAKGAGMICPNMATMLCFVTTDAFITKPALRKALKIAADNSFNCITVDGEMSTNDSLVILANGLAGNKEIKENSREFQIFTQALTFICLKLAKMIVMDGEGATHVIKVTVKGARSQKEAKTVADKVANSSLVKTMIAGANPNWGRIPACVGAAWNSAKIEKITVTLQGKCVYKNNLSQKVDPLKLRESMQEKDVSIEIDLNSGKYTKTLWASDLTHEYVQVNTEYN